MKPGDKVQFIGINNLDRLTRCTVYNDRDWEQWATVDNLKLGAMYTFHSYSDDTREFINLTNPNGRYEYPIHFFKTAKDLFYEDVLGD